MARTSSPAAACPVEEFLAKVGWLKNPVKWDAVYDAYKPPERSDKPVPQAVRDGLLQVWQVAPEFFRTELCSLTALFLDDSDAAPWGYRENPRQFSYQLPPAQYGRYVAIPSQRFIPLGSYEAAVVNHLVKLKVEVDPDNDSRALMGLGALAHEIGHIKFRQIMAPNYEPIDPQRLCHGQYWAGSWLEPVEIAPVNGLARYVSEHRAGPQIQEVVDELNLVGLFSGHRWVSLLAAYTPEHDFVEEYRSIVLAAATPPVHSMLVSIAGPWLKGRFDVLTIDLLAGLDDPTVEIGRKAACIRGLE